jgi:peptide/nickel transport system permease protein
MPNMVAIMAADIVLTMSATIGVEVGLTLVGFGFPPGVPSLGSIIQNAVNLANLQNRWWMWFPAMLLMFIIMLCINFVGQAVQRVADPRQRMV